MRLCARTLALAKNCNHGPTICEEGGALANWLLRARGLQSCGTLVEGDLADPLKLGNLDNRGIGPACSLNAPNSRHTQASYQS
eukprot:15474819-Alexandrium_andersonii.AAC.2